MQTVAQTFAEWLQQTRRACDLTQAVLAEQVGCSTELISKLERGERRPSRQIALLLAEQLGVPAEQHEAIVRLARGLRDPQPLPVRPLPDQVPPPPAREAGDPPRPAQTHYALGKSAQLFALTKLQPPRPRTDLLVRGRLIEHIRRRLTSTRLVLVSAPAGSGKTTLLATSVAAINCPYAWVTLDADDNNLVRFLTVLLTALDQLAAGGVGAAELLLDVQHATAPFDDRVQQTIAAAVNRLIDTLSAHSVLVLDDLHAITNPGVYDVIGYLTEYVPVGLTIAVTTRHDPPFNLSRLRARRELIELQLPDLRFTQAEMADLLNNRLALDLTAEQIAALHARTEGWAAGLTLLASSLETIAQPDELARFVARFAETDRYLFDYLADEVLNRQDPFVRAFLLETSVLPELTPQACQSLTGRGDAAEVLDDLYRRNLFLMRLESTGWSSATYRYHELFRTFLRERLRQEAPAWLRQLHQRAAAATSDPLWAIEHMLQAELWDVARDAIERIGEAALASGAFERLARWIVALPDTMQETRPRLLLWLGICHWQRFKVNQARAAFARARAGFQALNDPAGQGEALAWLALDQNLNDDFAIAQATVAEALAFPLPPHLRVGMLTVRALGLLFGGDWKQAAEAVDQAIALAETAPDPQVLDSLVSGLQAPLSILPGGTDQFERALLLIERHKGGAPSLSLRALRVLVGAWRGAWDAALEESREISRYVERDGAAAWQMLNGSGFTAMISAIRGIPEDDPVLRLLANPDAHFDSNFARSVVIYFQFHAARAASLRGDLDETRRSYARMAARHRGEQNPVVIVALRLLEGLIALSEHDLAAAEGPLVEAAALQDQLCFTPLLADAHLLVAAVKLASQQPEEALLHLEPRLAHYAHENVPGLLMWHGSPVIPLLRLAVERGVHAAFAARVLQLMNLSAAPLVGRAAQLATLDRLIARVAARLAAPRAVLISGEAGIGKSRLLAALQERLGPNWRTLTAACFEPYQSEPYAPLSDLLPRALAGLGDEQREAVLGAHAGTLALLPGLEQLAPPGTAPLVPESAQNQRRLFQALSELLTRLADAGPLLVAVEDVHWSDAATLAFLPVLAHALAARPALLVLTYRADETPPPLAAALADLDRRRLATELTLARLSRGEVDALLRFLVPREQPLPGALLDTLYSLTDGNPFFVEEVVTAMLASGAIDAAGNAWMERPTPELPIPRTVQEAVRRRSALLSPAAREVLTIAAVLGRSFPFAFLKEATGHDEAGLLGLLKELIAAKLLVEEGADQFAFRHALLRAAIYSGLLARERRVLHRQLAEALEQAGAYPGDLAHHFAEAGSWEQALRYAEAAAEQARRLHAPHEVVTHLTRALEAARLLPDTPLPPLLHLRGQANETLGDFAAALADYEAALAMAEASGRAEDEWQALLDMGFLWSSRDYARAGAYLQRMLDRARAMGNAVRLARSLNRFGNWHMNLDRPVTARRLHEEALGIVERLADERGLAETLDLLGISCFICGDLTQGTAYFRRAIELFTALDDRQGLIHSTMQTTLRAEFDVEAIEVLPLAPRSAPIERAVRLAHEMHWRVGESLALLNMGAHLSGLGEYGRALDLLRGSLAIAIEIEHAECLTHAHVQLGVLFLQLQGLPEAIEHLQQALASTRQTGQLMMAGTTSAFLAMAYAQQRSYDEAEEVLAQARAQSVGVTEASICAHQLGRAAAELALARGEPELALRRLDDLLVDIINPHNHVIPTLAGLRGQALVGLRRYEEAARMFEAGLRVAQVQGRRPLLWRMQVGLSTAALGQRQRDEAQRMAAAARATIDELANTIPDATLREGFQHRAQATLPEQGSLTPRQALKQVFGGLTDRELDVARLVARGYTNRQIAEALVLSERTVTTHIGHILSKLGFSSRAQIARWAAEHGIAPA